jgi:hypothetical protein
LETFQSFPFLERYLFNAFSWARHLICNLVGLSRRLM